MLSRIHHRGGEPGIAWLQLAQSPPSSDNNVNTRQKGRMPCLHNEGEFFKLGPKKSELIRKVFTAVGTGVDTWVRSEELGSDDMAGS